MTKAEASYNRANRLYHASVKVFFAFAFIMLCVIAFEVTDLRGNFTESRDEAALQRDQDTAAARKRLEKALAETQRQQIVTQNYIRCVAVISLLPIEQRSAEQLDKCGIPGVTDPRKLGQVNPSQSSTPSSQPSAAITPQNQPSNSASTGTSTPLTSKNAMSQNDESTGARVPVVSPLLQLLGL